jgi:ABC-type multidrug transport system permease subunit
MLSSDAVMAASIMPFFLVMCEFFNGVLQPQSLMPAIWAYTIYYVGPFTYWITGIADIILTPISVKCLDSELIRFDAPPNTTCGEYASDWLSGTTGYLSNPDATSSCGYCQYEGGRDVSFGPLCNTTPGFAKADIFHSI